MRKITLEEVKRACADCGAPEREKQKKFNEDYKITTQTIETALNLSSEKEICEALENSFAENIREEVLMWLARYSNNVKLMLETYKAQAKHECEHLRGMLTAIYIFDMMDIDDIIKHEYAVSSTVDKIPAFDIEAMKKEKTDLLEISDSNEKRLATAIINKHISRVLQHIDNPNTEKATAELERLYGILVFVDALGYVNMRTVSRIRVLLDKQIEELKTNSSK